MPSSTRRIGLLASTFSADLRQVALSSRLMGANGLLFDAFAGPLHLTKLSATGRREVRQILAGQDQAMVGLQADIGGIGLNIGADVDRIVAQFKQMLETAAGLVSPLVCVDIGPLPEPAIIKKPRPDITPAMAGRILLADLNLSTPVADEPLGPPPDPRFVAQVHDALVAVGALADRYNVVVAWRSGLSSFAALHDALHRVACPWFGIDLDPTCLQDDTRPADQIFTSVGPLIRHVRVRDALKGSTGRSKPAPIGKGNVPWQTFMQNLNDADYAGWLTVDATDQPTRPESAEKAITFLKNLS